MVFEGKSYQFNQVTATVRLRCALWVHWTVGRHTKMHKTPRWYFEKYAKPKAN